MSLEKNQKAQLNSMDAKLDTITGNTADIESKADTITSNTVDIESKIDVIDSYHDVPGIDSVLNAIIAQVLGNKGDTVGGDSAIARLKQIIAAIAVVDGLHDVPSQDSVADILIRDVIGKKSDTTGGNSIVSLIKIITAAIAIIDGFHDVPTADSATNTVIRDVIGNKNDTYSGSSIVAINKKNDAHIHNPAMLYPLLADSITLTKAAGVWAAIPVIKTEIIPANTINDYFDIHWVSINTISTNGEYTIFLYAGEAGSESFIGVIPAIRTAVQSQEGSTFCMSDIIDPNTRISGALSGSPAGAESLKVKVGYHTY